MASQPRATAAERAPGGHRRRRGCPPVADLEERRRAQIISSAVSVFAERGYPATTMSDIARHAGIGQGTIYRYVASKRELLDLVFDYSVEEVLRAVQPVLLTVQPATRLTDLLDRFDAALDALDATLDRQPELVSLVLVEAGAIDEELKLRMLGLETTVSQMVIGLFEEARAAGFLRPGADPEVCGRLATKLLVPVGLHAVLGQRDPETRHRYRAAMLDFARHAFFVEDTEPFTEDIKP